MKKSILFIVFAMISVAFTSCKKENSGSETVAKQNGFTLKGEFIATPDLLLFQYDKGDAELAMATSSYTINDKKIQSTNLSGISLDFQFDPSMIDVPAGTYTHSTDNKTLNTFQGSVAKNYNTDTESGLILDATGGSVKVVKLGQNEYEVDYTLTTSQGEVKGYYKGTVKAVIK